MEIINYTVYHLHDDLSLLDSCTKFKDYADKAVGLGQKSICVTNHGNIYNWVEKKIYCDEIGLKFMLGVECYLTETFDEKIRDNYHTVLIAKNKEGQKELFNLIFLSTDKNHKYYKPRLSFDEFLNISDNIIKISACLASPLRRYKGEKLELLLKHYDYYEIQPHILSQEQKEFNQFLYEMSKIYNKPLIAGTDTHSLNKYKAECRTILQLGKGIEFSNEDEYDLIYKSYKELVEMFKEQNSLPMDIVLQAIENTNTMADSVEDFQLDKSVKYPILYGEKDEEILWNTLREKYQYKLKNNMIDKSLSKKYGEKIKEEMRVFKKTNMIGFMLFMSELMTWCAENNIPTSPCRGSVGGSEVAYMGDITDVDPVRWNTVFSRFCNEDREEVGDIDVDFYEDNRPKVYNYIINRFGKEKTAYILANGTVVDKGAIDLIGRALDTKWRATHKDEKSPYSLDVIKQIKKEYENNPNETKDKYSDIFYYFEGILNTIISQSQHPAGIVASPINLVDNYGMFYGDDNQYILPINMEEIHETGLVKYDILGLKNIGIIRKTCELAQITYPKSHTINWNDQEVFEDINTSSIGIFQFEKDYAFSLLKKFNVHSIDDMSLVNASLRPSGASYRDNLMAHIPNKNPSELIDKLLEANEGYLIFQEDTIKFLQQICGLSGSEADNIRRAIGRKQIDRLQKALPSILEGYCRMSPQPRDIAIQEVQSFLKIIEDSSNYQFGYNHSTGYSMLGYLCGYMRYYYPLEFCCSYLNCANNDDDIYNGTTLAQLKHIKINSPKFRKSRSEFMIDRDTNSIYKGLSSIKNVSDTCSDYLYTIKDNKYEDFLSLLSDIPKDKVNSKQLDILIKLNFFSEFNEINNLLNQVEVFNLFNKCKTLKKEKCTELGFNIDDIKQFAEKETDKTLSGIDNKLLMAFIISKAVIPPTTIIDRVAYEIQLLGYTSICDESVAPDIYAVTGTETNHWGTTFMTLYQIWSGVSKTCKVDKKWYNSHLCKTGDIIQTAFRFKNKKTKVTDENGNEKWLETGETEEVLSAYCKYCTAVNDN